MRSGCGAADEWQQLRDDSEEHAAVVADSEVGGDVAADLRIAAAVGGQRSERQKFSGLSIDAGGGGGRPVPSAVPSWPIRSALCGALPVTAGAFGVGYCTSVVRGTTCYGEASTRSALMSPSKLPHRTTPRWPLLSSTVETTRLPPVSDTRRPPQLGSLYRMQPAAGGLVRPCLMLMPFSPPGPAAAMWGPAISSPGFRACPGRGCRCTAGAGPACPAWSV